MNIYDDNPEDKPLEEEDSSNSALMALIAVVALALIFAIAYFAWYAPSQEAAKNIEVSSPGVQQNIESAPKPSKPAGEAAGPGSLRTSPEDNAGGEAPDDNIPDRGDINEQSERM